jgi:tRNA modification GTPase
MEKAKLGLEAGESAEFVAIDLRDALGSVGEVIGKTDIEEILGEIFSTFCIGK